MGDLAQTLLSEKIRSLLAARKSGILVVSSSDVTKGIFFRAGQIVFASSTLEEDRLGDSLVRLGRISRSDFLNAYEARRQGRRRLGQELVGAGIVTSEELGRLVSHQVQNIILSLFKWEDGDLEFEEADEPIPADLALELSTHRLLFEGARIFPDVARLETALGEKTRRLRLSTRPPFDYTRLTLSPVERDVLNDAADEFKISEILLRPASHALLIRAIYALLVGGVVRDVEADREFAVIDGDSETFSLAAETERQAGGLDQKARALGLYEALLRASHYDVLEVPRDADRPTIEAAFERLNEAHERDFQELHDNVHFNSILSTLRLRRQEAFRVLSDEAVRKEYDERLGTLKGPKVGETPKLAQERARRLTKEAAELLDKSQKDRAIARLVEAAEAAPRDFDARRLLALALAQHETLQRSAERHFLAALELEPADVDLRYRFALYYLDSGLPRRAAGQLRTVLSVEPKHDGARRALAAIDGTR